MKKSNLNNKKKNPFLKVEENKTKLLFSSQIIEKQNKEINKCE